MTAPPPFQFTSGKLFRGAWLPGRIEPNRRLYDFELVFFAGGHARVFVEDTSFECTAGTVLVIPPNKLHCTVAVGPTERWCVHFSWFGDCRCHEKDLWPYVFADSGEPFHPEQCAKSPENLVFPFFRTIPAREIEPLLRRFFGTDPDKSFGDHLMRQGLLIELVGAVFASGTSAEEKTGSPGRIFLAGKEYVEKHCCESNLTVTCLANHFHVTPNYLSSLFRRNLGVPVHEYITSLRMLRARELLAGGRVTVREAAFASGFEDANYFTRAFTRRFGAPPGRFKGPAD